MKTMLRYVCLIAVVSLWWAQTVPAQAPAADPPRTANPTGAEVLTRGPVHEAFAQPASTGIARPLIIPKQPPEAIEESPPDAKPAGETAVWISGYWAWDDEAKDFLWVSGVWRVPPPGQQWVAGYWTAAGDGFQWVPGFWKPVTAEQVEYFPEPPESLERGPTSEPPSADYVWVPGCWRWHESRYVWQPGYWAIAQPDWVWVPASYYWCPRGWVYCDGYWDYPLAARGMLFAPVRFATIAYPYPHIAYTPTVVVDVGILSFHLFARPTYGHYYFGNYYAANYDRLGIFPWFDIRFGRSYAYDPLFSYYRWRYRTSDPQWSDNLRGWHTYYRQNADQRPPQTLLDQQRLLAAATDRPDRGQLRIADTLANVRQKADAPMQIAAVTAQEKSTLKQTARRIEEFKTQRAQLEGKAAAATPDKPGTAPAAPALKAPQKLTLPNMPALSSAREGTAKSKAGVDVPGTPGLKTPGPSPEKRLLPTTPGKPGIAPPAEAPKSNLLPQQPNVVPRETPRVMPRETPRAAPKETPEVVPRETPQVVPRESPRATPRETPQAVPRESPKATQREAPRVVPRETPQAVPRETPKAVPREAPRVEKQRPAPSERRAPEGGRSEGKGRDRGDKK